MGRPPQKIAAASHFSFSAFQFSAFPITAPPLFFSFQLSAFPLTAPHFRLATRHQSRYLLPCPRGRRNPHPERSQKETPSRHDDKDELTKGAHV
jgi:hypothetical protein